MPIVKRTQAHLVLALTFAYFVLGTVGSTEEGMRAMAANEQAIEVLEGVRDEVILHPDEERVLDYFYDLLADVEFEGIAIRVANVVDVTQHQEIPLILVSQETVARSADVVLGDNCIIVASHRESGQFWIGPAFREELSKIPMPEQPEDESLPAEEEEGEEEEELSEEISTQGIQRIDLAERLELSGEPGHYAVTAIAFDWLSNTGAMRLVDPRARRAAEPPIAPQDAIKVMESYQRGGEPGQQLPDFRRSARSPQVSGSGAALAVAPIASAIAPTLPVHGSFRVSVPTSWTVAPISEEGLGDLEQADATLYSNLPSVIVPAMVLLAEKGVLIPKTIQLRVPVFADRRQLGEETIEGYLSVDLASDLPEPLEPGAYNVYLIVPGYVSQPHPLQIEPPA